MAWYILGISGDPKYFVQFNWISRPSNIQYLWQQKEGAPISPELLPKAAQQISNHTELPDFLAIKGTFVVSNRFRSLVERFEPNTHQFVPIELIRPTGEQYSTQYYFLIVCNKFDALLIEKSDVRWDDVEQKLPNSDKVLMVKVLQPNNPINLTLRKSSIGDHHMWLLKKHLDGLFFFSDELMTIVSNMKMKCLDSKYCAEE